MSAMMEDMGPQRIKVIEAVRALKTALKCAIWCVLFLLMIVPQLIAKFQSGHTATETNHHQLQSHVLRVSLALHPTVFDVCLLQRMLLRMEARI